MFITKTFQMVSVLYDYKTQTIKTKDIKVDIQQTNGTHRNFPIGTFFDETRFMVYVVYRQGETFLIDLNNVETVPFSQNLTDLNFVSADLYNNDVLIVKECKKFKFFKIVKINELDSTSDQFQLRLEFYHSINISGFMSFGASQDQFRIVSDKFIYTY